MLKSWFFKIIIVGIVLNFNLAYSLEIYTNFLLAPKIDCDSLQISSGEKYIIIEKNNSSNRIKITNAGGLFINSNQIKVTNEAKDLLIRFYIKSNNILTQSETVSKFAMKLMSKGFKLSTKGLSISEKAISGILKMFLTLDSNSLEKTMDKETNKLEMEADDIEIIARLISKKIKFLKKKSYKLNNLIIKMKATIPQISNIYWFKIT